MGQNQSSEAGQEGAKGSKGSPLRSSLTSSQLGKGKSKEDGSSLGRSIQWAEQVATDMEETNEKANNSKKPRVRTRAEEEEYERKLLELQKEELGGIYDSSTGRMTSDYDSIVVDEDEEITEFEALVVKELKKRVSAHEAGAQVSSPRVKNLNSVLMKFPSIKEGFEKMRCVFESVDSDGSGDIDFQEWTDAMAEHGLAMTIPQDHALHVWREADVDKNNLIDFKEFVVVMSFLYLLDYVEVDNENLRNLSESNQSRRIHLHTKVKTAIDLVVETFLFFDKDGDGRIMKEEVMRGLDTSIGVSGKRYGEGKISTGIWRKRFAEMDCDKSGSISLKEFIFAFEDWVGFDESDDEDED